MSQAAVSRTCQIPWMSGCPSAVFGGVYGGMLAGACANAGDAASTSIAARNRYFTKDLLTVGFSRCRLVELRRIDRRVRPHLTQRDRHLHVGLAHGPLERHLHAVDVAVVLVVDLRRHAADRGHRPPHEAYKHPGLIEEKLVSGCPSSPP